MFYWMKPLPEADIDYEKYKPFISNNWFRQNFMYFVYSLQAMLVTLSILFGVWKFSNVFIKLIVFLMVYFVHELLHISVVWRIGDISLTHSGIFFWLNPSAKMSKMRFLLFMSMPLLFLSIVPMIIALISYGPVYQYMRYIAWINAIIVYCIIKLPKVAKQKWTMLHVQIGQSCKHIRKTLRNVVASEW